MKIGTLALIFAFLAVMGCKKPEKQNRGAPPDDEKTSSTSSLAIAPLELGVSAISAQGAFLTAQTSLNSNAGNPGSLAIQPVISLQDGIPDHFADFQLTTTSPDYRTPVLPSYSIASGAPEELILYVTKVTLSRASSREQQATAPFSVKRHHPALISSQYRAIMESLVGREFASMQDLSNAAVQAGIPESVLQSEFQNLAHEFGANWVPNSEDSAKGPSTATLFEDSAGKAIAISNGSVDLSALSNSSQSGFATFNVPEGEYNTVSIDFRTKASVKGCVKMLYQCLRQQNISPQCADTTPEADIPGSQGLTNGATSKLLTYCTQASKSLFTGVNAQNSDFLDKPPELMDFPLYFDSNGDWNKDGAFLKANYELPQPVILKVGESTPRITLLVDMNRMLRFYNRGRIDQGPTPSMPTTKAYFFTSLFPGNTFAFLGKPGKIYGFEMQANACLTSTTDSNRTVQGVFNTNTGKCANNTDPQGKVPFWMTIITDGSGAPLYALTSPDDDNDLTITKGDVFGYQGCSGGGEWVELVSGSSPQKATLRYALCSQGQSTLTTWGEYRMFPADLDGLQVVPSSTALGLGSISGIQIWSKSVEPQQPSVNSIYEGPVYVTRRL